MVTYPLIPLAWIHRITACGIWSGCRDSNPGPLDPQSHQGK